MLTTFLHAASNASFSSSFLCMEPCGGGLIGNSVYNQCIQTNHTIMFKTQE